MGSIGVREDGFAHLRYHFVLGYIIELGFAQALVGFQLAKFRRFQIQHGFKGSFALVHRLDQRFSKDLVLGRGELPCKVGHFVGQGIGG